MGKVQIEIVPWLSKTVDPESLGPVILKEEIIGDETVKGIIGRLVIKYPSFGEIVFDSKTQKLTGRVSLLLNGGFIELVNGLETRLNDSDTLTFVAALGGGGKH